MDLIFVWKSAILVTICFEVHMILSTSVPDNVSANASSPCDEGWDHHGEFCIIMEKQPVYWRQASSNCISMGGNLPSIHSKQQNDLYLELSQTAGINNLWIGLSDHVSNSIFEWQDGTVFDYKYWADPTCVSMYSHIIGDYSCFYYCRGHFRTIIETRRHFGRDDFSFCDCRCHYVNAFSSGDCVALSTSENGRWRGKRCSVSYGYLCQKKIATPVTASTERNDSTVTTITIAGAQDNDENVTATTIAGSEGNDENVTATTIAAAQGNDVNVTATTIAAAQDNDVNVTTTTIAGSQANDENVAATIISSTGVNDETEAATMITRTEVDNLTSTAITSTVMEVKTASTIITSTDVDDKTASTILSSIDLDDKTVSATTITNTDVDDRTAPVTLKAVSNVELKTVETTIIRSTDVNRKTALATNLTDVDDKTAATTTETSTDVNNGKTVAIITMTTEEADAKIAAKFNGAKQDDKSSWFSVKSFNIILSIIIMFMALVGGLYYYKRPWLEKQKLKVTTVFFRRLRTANKPFSSFVLNRNEKCDGSIDKFTTRYVSFRNKV